jgi:predicted nucleic acid-binding Zn ribbon protein
MEKQFSRTPVQFKGEGWYVTDYGRKGSVAEKVEKELSAPEASSTETTKPKKTTAKKTSSDKS